MGDWINLLPEKTRPLVPLLTDMQCQFAWRSENMVDSRNEPFDTGLCWFEVWVWGSLLIFDGPFECPMSDAVLNNAVVPVIEWVARLVEYRSF